VEDIMTAVSEPLGETRFWVREDDDQWGLGGDEMAGGPRGRD
jgi:hypothetical protein